MHIAETGEVRHHVRLPDPEEAPAFEVDVPQDEPHEAVSLAATEKYVVQADA